jgi:hypothetical protein
MGLFNIISIYWLNNSVLIITILKCAKINQPWKLFSKMQEQWELLACLVERILRNLQTIITLFRVKAHNLNPFYLISLNLKSFGNLQIIICNEILTIIIYHINSTRAMQWFKIIWIIIQYICLIIHINPSTYQILVKINEKCWRNFKFSSQVIIKTSHFCIVYHQKLKI